MKIVKARRVIIATKISTTLSRSHVEQLINSLREEYTRDKCSSTHEEFGPCVRHRGHYGSHHWRDDFWSKE